MHEIERAYHDVRRDAKKNGDRYTYAEIDVANSNNSLADQTRSGYTD